VCVCRSQADKRVAIIGTTSYPILSFAMPVYSIPKMHHHHFTKTGSGQTQGKQHSKIDDAFCAGTGATAIQCVPHLGAGCVKRLFCAIFVIKAIVLPRQARDKHRESSTKKKGHRFVQGAAALRHPAHALLRRYSQQRSDDPGVRCGIPKQAGAFQC
jgi:hypothetical protein